jgi:NADP-dependent 3-hydroxy acid dehydrogenase YdfG
VSWRRWIRHCRAGLPLLRGTLSRTGEATAHPLARLGVDVAVRARRTDRCRHWVTESDKHGRRALSLGLDVTDEQACRDAVAQSRSKSSSNDAGRGLGMRRPSRTRHFGARFYFLK